MKLSALDVPVAEPKDTTATFPAIAYVAVAVTVDVSPVNVAVNVPEIIFAPVTGPVNAPAPVMEPVIVGFDITGSLIIPPASSTFDCHAVFHCAGVHTWPCVIVPFGT